MFSHLQISFKEFTINRFTLFPNAQIGEEFTPATNSCLSCKCKSKQDGGLFCENLSQNCPKLECGGSEVLTYRNGTCCPYCQRLTNPCKTKTKTKNIEIKKPGLGNCKSEKKVIGNGKRANDISGLFQLEKRQIILLLKNDPQSSHLIIKYR